MNNTQDILEKLRQGECILSYFKITGELKDTTGTLNTDVISQFTKLNVEFKDQNHENSAITYWDTCSNNYRAFSVDRLNVCEIK